VAVLFTAGEGTTFDDCVVGPDGWLYLSTAVGSTYSVQRLNLSNVSGGLELLTTLTSKARGLAFNVATLYINTASLGVKRLEGISEDHISPYPAPVSSPSGSGSGRGLVFDVSGTMRFASVTELRTSPPLYSANNLLLSGLAPFGVAVNTCGEVTFADTASQKIRHVVGGVAVDTDIDFSGGESSDMPLYIEIDSSNQIYIVTGTDTYGANARIWRATPTGGPLLSTCGTYELTELANLDDLYCGGDCSTDLASDRAIGIALPPTSHSLTHTFAPSALSCNHVFNFGYHALSLTFETCPDLTLDVIATKSFLDDVSFDPPLDPSTKGMRYSPLGGFLLQYTLLPESECEECSSPAIPPFLAKYGFFTQDVIKKPGVARSASDTLTDPYNQDVTSDFWDVGSLDPSGGERGDDFSRRIVFNADLTGGSGNCSAGPFEEPLQSGNPLFKSNQDVKIAFKMNGAGCLAGTLHVSIVRIVGTSFVPMTVKSKSNAQTGNVMSISGQKYRYNLDTNGYPLGDYLITIWGDVISPISKAFKITK